MLCFYLFFSHQSSPDSLRINFEVGTIIKKQSLIFNRRCKLVLNVLLISFKLDIQKKKTKAHLCEIRKMDFMPKEYIKYIKTSVQADWQSLHEEL